MKRFLIVLVLCCAGIHGQAAFDAPVVESVEVLQKEAEAGDVVAQHQLARDYLSGKDVAKDPQKALAWFRRAAAGGLAPAQYDLGVTLANGKDTPRDEKEAARWFYAAAQSGIFEAQTAMIDFYNAGRGVEKSPAKALAWDMIARRTLRLRTGLDAGLPPKPGELRADGAAEVMDQSGSKSWVLPDGSRVSVDADGVRHLSHKDGARSTVQKDGSWETVFANGFHEQMTADGRHSFTDAKGTVETWAPDGSHSVEGDGTTEQGQRVRVRDTFGLDGKRISHRVRFGDSALEELADGTKFVETDVKRDDGAAMILKEDVDGEGRQTNGHLRRADNGVGPKGSEIWAIQRTLHLQGGETALVAEKYSEFGRYSQEVISRAREVAAVSATPVPRTAGTNSMPGAPGMPGTVAVTGTGFVPPNSTGPMTVSIPITTIPIAVNGEDPTAFAKKPDIQPMLGTLAKIESETRNFAGAKEADYLKAQSGAQSYVIPVAQPPQRVTAAPAWMREKTITQSTLHEPPLLSIPDDRSSKVPFGVYGSEAIKMLAWKHAETEHFIVHYVGESEAKLTMQYIEGVFTVLTELLNLDSRYAGVKSHVFIFPEVAWKDFQKKNGLPPQVAGFAFRTELMLGANANRQDKPEATKVICHEVTHALVARFYPGLHGPLWLNEGLAEYIALRTMRTKGSLAPSKTKEDGTATDNGHARASAAARLMRTPDKEIDVDRLFTRERYGTQTSVERLVAFYANSQKAVETLFEKLPVEQFPRFFNLIMAGNEPGISLSTAYGKQCDGTAAFAGILNGR